MILASTPRQAAQKISLHGGGANAFASAEPAAVYAIEVLLKDHLLEALTGSLARLNPG